jgi:RHS repeat-associated protein
MARLVFEESVVPEVFAGKLHVFLQMGNHLGSSSIVLDKATGELVERTTYEAYGNTESDYRPDRWKNFREDYKFTGKEEDIEVGLQFFGYRYYAPALNRWISADLLTIHGMGADLNAYAYVNGHVLKATDPLGLEEKANAIGADAQGNPVAIGKNGEILKRSPAEHEMNGTEPFLSDEQIQSANNFEQRPIPLPTTQLKSNGLSIMRKFRFGKKLIPMKLPKWLPRIGSGTSKILSDLSQLRLLLWEL